MNTIARSADEAQNSTVRPFRGGWNDQIKEVVESTLDHLTEHTTYLEVEMFDRLHDWLAEQPLDLGILVEFDSPRTHRRSHPRTTQDHE
jgi:hypothetical protein